MRPTHVLLLCESLPALPAASSASSCELADALSARGH